MTDEAFIDQLRATSNDDALRLVYADWLEEQGDVRGEFLRLAVTLEKLEGDPSLPGLRRSMLELRAWVHTEWVARACRAVAADEVREAVVRCLLDGITSYGLAFLKVEGWQDPSWYLLARLAATPPRPDRPIQFKLQSALRPPDEECEDEEREDEEGSPQGLVDAETGESGVFLEFSDLKWVAEDRCEVEAGICEDAESGVYRLHKVHLQAGCWTVTEDTIVWTM